MECHQETIVIIKKKKKNKREKNDSTKDPMRNRTRSTRLKIMVLNH